MTNQFLLLSVILSVSILFAFFQKSLTLGLALDVRHFTQETDSVSASGKELLAENQFSPLNLVHEMQFMNNFWEPKLVVWLLKI